MCSLWWLWRDVQHISYLQNSCGLCLYNSYWCPLWSDTLFGSDSKQKKTHEKCRFCAICTGVVIFNSLPFLNPLSKKAVFGLELKMNSCRLVICTSFYCNLNLHRAFHVFCSILPQRTGFHSRKMIKITTTFNHDKNLKT